MNKKYRYLFFIPLLSLLGCSELDRPSINFYLAIERGDLHQVARHIYWKADVNALNKEGKAPLHVAAENGNFSLTTLLLKHHADINLADQQGLQPIQYAVLNKRYRLAKLLQHQGADIDSQSLMFQMVRQGIRDKDTLKWLIRQGADLNQADHQEKYPLYYAIQHQQLKMVKLLIQEGADINQVSAQQSPLAQAKSLALPDIINLLTHHGALE